MHDLIRHLTEWLRLLFTPGTGKRRRTNSRPSLPLDPVAARPSIPLPAPAPRTVSTPTSTAAPPPSSAPTSSPTSRKPPSSDAAASPSFSPPTSASTSISI